MIPKKTLKRRVLSFGTFDILHPGHVFFLKSAKKKGDELFVIIARDSSVQKIKKIIPHFSENERKLQVESLSFVDFVFLGDENDFLRIPKAINPDVIVLGYDQAIPSNLAEIFPNTKIIRLTDHFSEEFKSSKLRK